MITLSILMASTPERSNMFKDLYNKLLIQREYCRAVHPTLGHVEIIIDDSKRFLDGGLSIGKKREKLVSEAKGEYCCFLDSDDDVSGNYIETLLRLCYEDKDVCSFNAIAKVQYFWAVIDMSISNENQELFPGIVKRLPWHICPVRTKYAKRYEFQDISYGEDWAWFQSVLKHCQFEAKTDAIIYEYRHGLHSQADEIIKHKNKCTHKIKRKK